MPSLDGSYYLNNLINNGFSLPSFCVLGIFSTEPLTSPCNYTITDGGRGVQHIYISTLFENIDTNIDKAILENIHINIDINNEIDIDIDQDILENINIDIDKGSLKNINIDKDIFGKKIYFFSR